jgi:hypothetical protein
VDRKSNEEIKLFVRDEQSGRLIFNGKALRALGIDPVGPQKRGYPGVEVCFRAIGWRPVERLKVISRPVETI